MKTIIYPCHSPATRQLTLIGSLTPRRDGDSGQGYKLAGGCAASQSDARFENFVN